MCACVLYANGCLSIEGKRQYSTSDDNNNDTFQCLYEPIFGHFENEQRACSGMFATWWSYVSIFFNDGKAHAIYCVTSNYLSNENGTIQGNLSSLLQFYDYANRGVEDDSACVCGSVFVCGREQFASMKCGENTT